MNKFLIAAAIFISLLSSAQSASYSSSEIYDDLLRLQNKTTVMYVAAHPDDENTRIISWLTHEKHVDAVYLSLTRGDGGQNLIGTEKGELLGLLRTQELLEARKIDKGRQWFTRALDFGYSKTVTETLKFWDKEQILADVVWAIRKNRPEIIITRFDPNSNGETHGHHTASAILAMEAFDLAADPKAYPEQLKYVKTWQAKRMFYNTSWWFFGSKENFEKSDKTGLYSINVGNYYPLLGISNNEISAKARSMHACQGFGTVLERGNETEYLKLLKGDQPKTADIFEGISLKAENTPLQKQLDLAVSEYQFRHPNLTLQRLLQIYELMKKENSEDSKLEKVKDLLLKSQGIYLEWTTEKAFGTSGEEISTQVEIANRSKDEVTFIFQDNNSKKIPANESFQENQKFSLPAGRYSNPYWMEKIPQNNFFITENPENIGQAEISNALTKNVTFNFGSINIDFDIPLQQKTVDPSMGELYEPFYTVPSFVANFEQENFIFNNQPKQIAVNVQSFAGKSAPSISLKASKDWKISPAQKVNFTEVGEKQSLYFQVEPISKNANSNLEILLESNGKTYNQSLQVVDYPHIDRQIWLKKSQVQVQNLDLKIPAVSIAYIVGSGDDIPASLNSIGLKVDVLDIKNWNAIPLQNYDVLILGIRAFNTQPELAMINQDLWKFVENGGLVINQYNTNRGLLTNDIAPFPLKLGSGRISEEDAKLKMLVPDHPVFNSPNKITEQDFNNWVQERGLYFADSWHEKMIPLLEGNDTGESPKQGSLLVGKYGKGTYVYTGLSFFRELPAGVPGAYRLFMNILALK